MVVIPCNQTIEFSLRKQILINDFRSNVDSTKSNCATAQKKTKKTFVRRSNICFFRFSRSALATIIIIYSQPQPPIFMVVHTLLRWIIDDTQSQVVKCQFSLSFASFERFILSNKFAQKNKNKLKKKNRQMYTFALSYLNIIQK